MLIAKGSLGPTFSQTPEFCQPPYGHKPRFPVISLQTPLQLYHTCFLLFLTLVQHHNSPGKSSVLRENARVAWGEGK